VEPARFMLLSAIILLVAVSESKVDPDSGHIRIISIGESFYPETRLPFMLGADPRIRYQPVPTNWYEGTFQAVGSGREDAEKFLRLYIPRTYDRFIGGYDVILLSDFEVDIIDGRQWSWMETSVRVDGMGIGKYEMNYDPAHWTTFDLFRNLPVYQAFPASLAWGREFTGIGIYAAPLPQTGRPHPVIDLPNMKNGRIPIDIGSGKAGYEDPRPGSTVIARYIPNDEPAVVIWEYGEGRAMTSVPGHDTIVWHLSDYWPYTVDYWINQAWYLAGIEIPPVIEILHQIRESSVLYSTQRTMALSVIDFAEKFGASTGDLYRMLEDVDEAKSDADRLYMEDDYAGSISGMELALLGLARVAESAVEAKDAVLNWIYTIEWAIVSATSAIVGTLVWSLMVRRSLYRDVSLTRKSS